MTDTIIPNRYCIHGFLRCYASVCWPETGTNPLLPRPDSLTLKREADAVHARAEAFAVQHDREAK